MGQTPTRNRERGIPRCVYLDYAATTPVDPQVVEAMAGCLGRNGIFGNPASHSHVFGREARRAVEDAREQVALLIGADPDEIIWTSGATESVNLAIKGVAFANAHRGRHIVTSGMEHKAILDTCGYLERNGFDVTYVQPDRDGLISPDRVRECLRDSTILVSLMHVNNEVGTITDMETIAGLTCARGIAFHVDAAQSAARLPLDMRSCRADLVSLSGHKMYGPKGVGALYLRRRPRVTLEARIHGGGHEQGYRSGTLPTHQIVGMGVAARLVRERRDRDDAAIAKLDRRLSDRLAEIEYTFPNGNQAHRVAGIMNMCFASVESESLMMSVRDIAMSSGSACTSERMDPSHVLSALGLSEDLTHCSVRLSLGRFTSEEDVDFAAARIGQSVEVLRKLSSRWPERLQGRYAAATSIGGDQVVTAA